MNARNQLLIHLTTIPGIGPVTIHKLFATVLPDDLIEEFYIYTVKELQEKFSIPSYYAQRIVEGLADKRQLEKELFLMSKNNIQVITFFDELYPAQLRKIEVPPVLLYYVGTFLRSQRSLAIVGSRQASDYSQKVISSFMPPLVNLGCTIVSGGALGADAMAHREALRAQGTTYAILGSGLLNRYPREHYQLFDQIIDNGGALISSFSLQTVPHAGNFPARNRIIAGLSDGCLIVQAMEKSGAKITAQYALDQAREVFTIPGLIFDPLSAGCHQLIKEGAHLVTSAHEIIEIMYQKWAITKNELEIDTISHENELPIASLKEQSRADDLPKSISNNEIEHLLVELCKNAKSTIELMGLTQKDLPTIQRFLIELTLEGKITQLFTGSWLAV